MKQFGKITQTAFAVPKNRVTNHDLQKIMDTSDEWIRSRTGIAARRIATEEDTSDLCIQVAKQLLDKAQISGADLDFIIVATTTADYTMPSTACLVHQAISQRPMFTLDVSAACAGFVYALSLGEKLISSGSHQRGLVIGGEVFSKLIDWNDRTTAVLFGDGAGGILLEASNQPYFLGEELLGDGSRSQALVAAKKIIIIRGLKAILFPWII